MNRDEIREFYYREGLIYFDEKAMTASAGRRISTPKPLPPSWS